MRRIVRRLASVFIFVHVTAVVGIAQGPGGGGVLPGGVTATIGTVITPPQAGGYSDIVLDWPRQRLYFIGVPDKIDVYSITQRRFLAALKTDSGALDGDLSRDGKFLYVTAFNASNLNIVDLDALEIVRRVNLPARPQGVAVGSDGRVLISTIGAGTNNAQFTLLLYDPAATTTSSLSTVGITPPAAANPILPAPSGRPVLSARSQLVASPDGEIIVGVNLINANTRVVFVYEVASASVLRSRSVTNISSTLTVAPDKTRFMSGLNLFDMQTLEVLAQQNLANAPFPVQQGTNFNTQANQGGSVFSPDGQTLYSAFNISPVQNPPASALVSELMLNDPDNLLIRMGLKLPENLAGKMVITPDGATIFAISDSGVLNIPVSTLRTRPIAVPERTTSLLVNDQCGVRADQRTASVSVRNEGGGQLGLTTLSLFQQTGGPAAIGGAGGAGAGAPGGGAIIIIPGIPVIPGGGDIRPGLVPIGGNPAQGPAQNTGIAGSAPASRPAQITANSATYEFTYNATNSRSIGTTSPSHDFIVQTAGAVNIPPRVRLYQNNREAEARGDIVPIDTGISANEGLVDLAFDAQRRRVYIANSGMNRVEVYDIGERRLLAPVKVGQLPRSIAISLDGTQMFVGNSGGESISVIDLDTGQVTGRLRFPPLPFNSGVAIATPSIISMTLRGLVAIMSNGTVWRAVGNDLVPRDLSRTAVGSVTLPAPRTMASSPNGEYTLILGGNGNAYLYDALQDDVVISRQVFQANQLTGYYGPISAGPRGSYYLVNGTVLNSQLTPISQATTPPISALTALGPTSFARFAQPVRANANAIVTEAPAVEVVDAASGATMRRMPALEGPLSSAVGNQRANIDGRTMAVDSSGTTAYLLTVSGLQIVALEPLPAADRPVPNTGGTVSVSSYLPQFAPGSLISIFGRNLGAAAQASTTPLPRTLGGVCVTLNNQALPLLMTSTGQINAQIPPEMAAGNSLPLIVRSIDRNLPSLTQRISIAKYAPGVLVDTVNVQAAIFESASGEPINRNNPTTRDRRLTIYATGLGVTKGGRVTAGNPAPSNPLAVSDTVQVFFGDPRIKESEMVVEWSGLVPGFIGLYQINIYVPGDRVRGENLPVTLRIGGIESQKSGPAVPTVAVN